MNETPTQQFIAELQARAHAQGLFAEIAERLNVATNTVRAMLNPTYYDPDYLADLAAQAKPAKLGIRELPIVLDVLDRDRSAWAQYCHSHRGVFVPDPPPQKIHPSDVHRYLAEATKEFSDQARAVAEAVHPDSPGGARITPREAVIIEKEVNEAIAALHSIKNLARIAAGS